jgi:hypothetical protein
MPNTLGGQSVGTGGAHVMRLIGRFAVVAVVGVLAVSVVSCSQDRSVTSVVSPTPKPEKPAVSKQDYRTQADILADAVLDYVPPGYLTDDPPGDIGPKSKGFEHFYAVLSDVATSPATVTFDVEQYLSGEAARKAAAQDGQYVSTNGDDYYRNRHRHKQTLHVSAQTPVILQDGGLEGHPSFESNHDPSRTHLTPLSFAEFAALFKSNPEKYASCPAYVLSYDPNDGGYVSGIFQVYFP